MSRPIGSACCDNDVSWDEKGRTVCEECGDVCEVIV